ncbi:MAG: NAD-dependent epimerase/dehydratase family protein [Proteobacteria bacterium]|nr:NAD-dependent epimerase/dehydratase family protein [Pseudomonadota bacterium]
MMKILITGAGGYIGHALTQHLAAQGHEVTALTRSALPDYHDPLWNGADIFKEQKLVIHAAARVHQHENPKNIQALYHQDNVDFPLHIATLAAQAGVKRFLFISSVGAQLLENRFHEGRITAQKAWNLYPYRMSKLEAERKLQVFARQSGLSLTSIRLPMVYGVNAPGSFTSLLHFMRRGWPLPFGGLTQPRAFASIETVKDFFSHYLRRDGPGVFAIRDKDEISPKDFALLAAQAAKLPPPSLWACPPWLLNLGATFLNHGQTARSLAEPLQVDLGPVQHEWGWQPALTTAEGLRQAFK